METEFTSCNGVFGKAQGLRYSKLCLNPDIFTGLKEPEHQKKKKNTYHYQRNLEKWYRATIKGIQSLRNRKVFSVKCFSKLIIFTCELLVEMNVYSAVLLRCFGILDRAQLVSVERKFRSLLCHERKLFKYRFLDFPVLTTFRLTSRK